MSKLLTDSILVGIVWLLCWMLPADSLAQSKAAIQRLKEQAIDKNKAPSDRVKAYNELTRIYFYRDLERAERYCREAFSVVESDTSLYNRCDLYNNQTLLYYGIGQYNEAIQMATKAVNLAQELKTTQLLTTAYVHLGLIYTMKGYAYKAISYNIAAATKAEEIGDQQKMARSYYYLGKSFSHLEDTSRARYYLSKALVLRKQKNPPRWSSLLDIEQGLLAFKEGQWEQAEQWVREGIKVSKEYNNQRGFAYGNYVLGELYHEEQFNDQAMSAFEAAMKAYKSMKDIAGQVQVLKGQAKVQLERQQYKSAETYLNQALNLARKIRARVLLKDVYQALADVQAAKGDFRKAMNFYRKYHIVKDSLLNRDKNREIVEIETKYKTRELQQEKAELEEKRQLDIKLAKEREQTQQLKNKQNYYIIIGLICGLALIVIIGLLVFRQDKLKTTIRETDLEQRALRSQMNPHFIFNSLNSIQSLIATDNNAEASIYLAKFSRLMRQILQNSRQAYIPLRQEIEFLDNYIELEQRRFKEAFDYHLEEEAIEDAHFVMIPPLVIQPFIENAIIHGLLRKSEKGTLTVRFEDYTTSLIKCTIKDNGIGRAAAAAFKTDNSQESLGIKITTQRLQYLTIKQKISEPFIKVIDLKDETGQATGTQVELLLPIRYKA